MPNHPDTERLRENIYSLRDNNNLAGLLELSDELLDSSTAPSIHFIMGRVLGIDLTAYERAETHFQAILSARVELDTAQAAELFYHLGRVILSQQDVRRSLAYLHHALYLNDQLPMVYVFIGAAHTALAEHGAAQCMYDKAQRLDPQLGLQSPFVQLRAEAAEMPKAADELGDSLGAGPFGEDPSRHH